MRMKLFESFRLKFEQADWSKNLELGLLDTILELHPELIKIFAADIVKGSKQSVFGRKDMPSVEQIVRAALYKEIKGLDYRELEYHQSDSRICEQFIKLDLSLPYSFQMYQKYISRISRDSLNKFKTELNKIAIKEGLEDITKLRQDSTVIETNIHYPTNNSLVWDCIRESHRLLAQLQKEIGKVIFRNYTKNAKKLYFLINNTKTRKSKNQKGNAEKSGDLDKRAKLFRNQLITLTKSINQVFNVIEKKDIYSISPQSELIILSLERLLPLMHQVYAMTWKKEIKGEQVHNEEKLYSIYELHTDIIVKGSREIQFGHKINLATGKSNLILGCNILKGNPSDSSLYQGMIEEVITTYGIVPRDIATDGGYASIANMEYSQEKGIINIVFNKICGSLENISSSKNMTTRLKKWRSGIEAVISNLKRGYSIFRCNWKGEAHFNQKVLWSVIAYNIRVMTGAVLQRL